MRYASYIWLLLCTSFILWNLGENSQLPARDSIAVFVFPILYVGYLIFITIFLWQWSKIKKQKYSVENFLRDWKCKLLSHENNEHIINYVKQISDQYLIPNPQIHITEAIRNNSFSISDGKSSVIIISSDIIEKLDSTQVESILRHELYHLKFFTINKFERITSPELSNNTFFYLTMALPVAVISLFGSYEYPVYPPPFVVFAFLAMFYKIGVYFYMSQTADGSIHHSTNISELLADTFSILHNRNFDDLKSAITTINEQPVKVPLSNIYECFVSKEEHDSPEILEEQQRKRKEHIEVPRWKAFLRQELEFKSGPYNNWVDIIHEGNESQGNTYSNSVRLQFINDLKKMSNQYVEIKITKKARNSFVTDRFRGDVFKSDLWRIVFKSHQIPDDKVLDALLSYFKTHENNFNLVMCAKELGLPEFTIFLGLARHIFYRNILLKWRYPIKFNFDY